MELAEEAERFLACALHGPRAAVPADRDPPLSSLEAILEDVGLGGCLTSNTEGRIDWVAGVFYEQQDRVWNLIEFTPGLNEFLWGDGTSVVPNDFALLSTADYSQFAVYGEATLHVTDRLDVTGGIRYFDMKDEIEMGIWYPIYDGLDGFGDPDTAASFFPDGTGAGNQSFDDIYFKGNISFKATDDILLYATFSQGFRRGGANATSGVQIPAGAGGNVEEALANARFYDPDTVDSYEIGFKSQWLDRRLTINAAGYWMDWKDRQGFSSSIEDDSGIVVNLPISQRVNLGDSTSKGFEVETRLRATDALTLFANLSYNTLKEKDRAPGFRTVGNPSLQGNVGTNYSQPVMGDWILDLGINSQFKTKVETGRPEQETLSGYVVADVFAGLSNDNWSVRLYADNVTDKQVQTSLTVVEGRPVFYINTPLTVGLDIGYRF